MRIAYVGATGAVGKVVVKELSRRGLEVTAITTHPEEVDELPHVTAQAGDANDGPALAALLKGHDVVVTSIQFAKTDPDVLIEAVKASGVPRYVVAGGSGTLLAPGTNTRLMDTRTFPANFAAPAAAAARFFDRLQRETELNWTYLSPPPGFAPGPATGHFRLGLDEVLVGPDGTASISYGDYAIALADEIERPQHAGRRFTVGY
jgi:putative NADH-flavin reductase